MANELRQVVPPSADSVGRGIAAVLIVVVSLATLMALLDLVFAKGALWVLR